MRPAEMLKHLFNSVKKSAYLWAVMRTEVVIIHRDVYALSPFRDTQSQLDDLPHPRDRFVGAIISSEHGLVFGPRITSQNTLSRKTASTIADGHQLTLYRTLTRT